MKATEAILTDIADMLGIDYAGDDEKARIIKKLGHYVAAAEAFIASAGVTVDYDSDPRILDAVTMYAGRRYDDPAQITTYADNTSMSLNALLEQIRLDQLAASEAEKEDSVDTSTEVGTGNGAGASTGASSDASSDAGSGDAVKDGG